MQVHHILAEIIQGGLVLETNLEEIDGSGKSPSCDEKQHASSCACTCVRASIRLVFLSSGTFLRPTDSERGALAHAISRAHIDAAGFATVMEIITGYKLWIIGYPTKNPQLDYPKFTNLELDVSAYDWTVCVLKPKDKL